MSFAYTLEQIEDLRDIIYHRTPELRATSEEKALAFINEVGFGFLFGEQAVEIPTLWAAVCGSRRPMPNTHFDADVGRAWDWKDTLPTRGLIHYGKLLRNKPTFVSLEMLPYFYALSPNYGELDDYLQQYEDGKLSFEAKSVYEVLLNEGAMATTRLRQLANLAGGGQNARRFDRAVSDLQIELKIAKVGVADTNRWGYAYVYDLFMRRYPQISEQARQISTDEAMSTLLCRYLRNVIVQPASRVQRLFRWEPWEWNALLDRLADEGSIRRGISVEGLDDNCLAAPETVITEYVESVLRA